MILGAILLLVAALACIAAELFIPSHGIMALFAALFALGSVIMAYRAAPYFGVIFGVVVLAAAPVVLFYAIRIYPKTPVGKRVMLENPSPSKPFDQEAEKLQQLIGRRGVSLTFLRPAGSVDFDGNRIDCLAESEMIPPNTPVEVLRVTGLKVIVKPVPADA